MNAGELYDAFRSDVVDTAKPYLWADAEVYRYMDAAYKMFVRLTGGIADFTSEAAEISASAGERSAEHHPSILRFLSAQRKSDGVAISILNLNDASVMGNSDYGNVRTLLSDNRVGQIRGMIIGRQRGVVEFVGTPVEDDTILLTVERLPLVDIVDETHELNEVDAHHHIYLIEWMKHLAYKKQDAETFDKTKSEDARQSFEQYCSLSKHEFERERFKPRVVQYGG